MCSVLRERGFKAALLVMAFAVAVAIPIVNGVVARRHDRHMTSSCANHAIQLKFLVRSFVEEQKYFPPETNARGAFAKMGRSDDWPAGWLSSYSSACPESFLRDKSIGYVFVADGLATKTAVEQAALVFFCPADSHQGSEQHCHAVLGDGLRCLESNAELIQLLRQELSRARAGIVPYSTNAQALLQRELVAREGHEHKRGPRSPHRVTPSAGSQHSARFAVPSNTVRRGNPG